MRLAAQQTVEFTWSRQGCDSRRPAEPARHVAARQSLGTRCCNRFPAAACNGPRRKTRRSGITILEVLISIGVATIGIFGVMAMLPLGGYFAQKGLNEDNKSAVGKAAYREFRIRGMSEFENWVNSNNSPAGPPAPAEGICIDPRFVSRNGNANVVVGPANASRFPYVVAAPGATMRRITLRSQPMVILGNPFPGGTPMSAPLADQIFQNSDDLIFHPQSDNTLPPIQEYTGGDTKRQSHGKISWLATLAPKLANQSDLYTLSIVVFYKRELDLNLTNERVAAIAPAGFYGQGIGGGDVQLTSVNNVEAEVEVKEGDWVMLSQTLLDTNGNAIAPVFKWYRVIQTDPEPDNSSGNWTRDVTLAGPDWNPSFPTQVTIASGAIGVFEKTIRRETSSLWTQIDK